jgi:hypothetical protein
VVARRILTTATGHEGLAVDLSLVMAGFTFARVWRRRRVFRVNGVDVPVARLADIVTSKAAAGRLKDRLFLATHAEALEHLVGADRTAPGSRKAPRHEPGRRR